jgi:two-component system NtrC family sensor kinase
MNSQHETGPGAVSSDVAIPSRSPDATKPSRKKRRSLSRQVALLLIGLTLALAALSFATQTLVVLPAFANLENEAARRDVRLCTGALNRDIELISNLTNDWSAWDDTYRYIQGKYTSFEEVNLIDESFSNSKLNVIALFDEKKRLVWEGGRNLETLEKLDFSDLFATLADPKSDLLDYGNPDDSRQGIMLTDLGPVLAAIRPIITSKREGPIRGALVMGRLLTEDEIAGLAKRAQIDLAIWPVTDKAIPENARALLDDGLIGTTEVAIVAADSPMLEAFHVIPDISGNPALLMRINVPRTITSQGKIAVTVATTSSIVGGLLMVVGAGWMIRRLVIKPVELMAAHALEVGKKDNLKSRLGFARGDEIGVMANAFDQMVESIAESRRKLLDAAHRSGMADVASEVLHNVGNAMNSANASLERLEENAAGQKLDGLQKANALLQSQSGRSAEFFAHDPRGPKLIDYIGKITESLQQESQENRQILRRLRETIVHIQQIITLQQSNARHSVFVQEVDAGELIAEAIEMNRALIEAAFIEMDIRVVDLPALTLCKSKVSQILVNLIKNAVDAMKNNPGQRRLSVVAWVAEENGLGIEVGDTGVGIKETDRPRLFTQGFSTKSDGNGIGLHFCANALHSMGGTIMIHSDGPGLGAVVRIWLPGVILSDEAQPAASQAPLSDSKRTPKIEMAV